MVLGLPDMVEKVQKDLEEAFMCKEEGELMEYVGSKLTLTQHSTGLGTVKFIQPTLVRKLEEEYMPPIGMASRTPAVVGQVLVKGSGNGAVHESKAKMYQAATATCMYMMQSSHPDTFNAMHGLARHMTALREAHVRALITLIKSIVSTENRGLVLSPKKWWSSEHKFKINGRLDSEGATNTDDC
jgi:hypothetical protein